jgi:hypothetical protein
MATHRNDALFAECKWKNSDINTDVYQDLMRKSKMFSYKRNYIYIFTIWMFSEKLLQIERSQEDVHLITLAEMITLLKL